MGQGQAVEGRDDGHEIERHRYNVAFGELGLAWYWDERTYAELQSTLAAARSPLPRSPVHLYVERDMPHLLRAYEPHFLVDAVEGRKSQLHAEWND